MKSNGCESRPAKASEQAVASGAIHRATGGCEAYTARKPGREDSAPKSATVAMPKPFCLVEGCTRRIVDILRNCAKRDCMDSIFSS